MPEVKLQLELRNTSKKYFGEKVDIIHEILIVHQKLDPGYTFNV